MQFKTKLTTAGPWVVVRLPETISKQLPSRGQVMIEGKINDMPLQMPLEPDGKWGHWFRVDEKMQKAIHAKVGDVVKLEIVPTKNWVEPEVPADFQAMLDTHPKVHDLWRSITPMARWEWIRWTRSTANAETHKKRIEVARSKMASGERRPCCWNRNLCTEPLVSKSGVLLDS